MRLLLPLEAGALENTIQRARWHVDARLSRYGDRSRFDRMPELPVAARGPNVPPAVTLKQFDEFTELHDASTVAARYNARVEPPRTDSRSAPRAQTVPARPRRALETANRPARTRS